MPTPIKFTEGKRKAYLELLAKGHRRGAALEQLGMNKSLLSHYCLANPEFRLDCENAELEACDLVEDALWLKCLSGHFGSIVFWLLNRSQGRWTDKRNITVQHNGEAPFSAMDQQAILGNLEKLKHALSDTTTTRTETLRLSGD